MRQFNLQQPRRLIGLLIAAATLSASPAAGSTVALETLSIQLKLKAVGYEVGTADGQLGPHTAQALARFQKDIGLPVTAKIDYLTQLALLDPAALLMCSRTGRDPSACLAALVTSLGGAPVHIPAEYDEPIARALFVKMLAAIPLANDREANRAVQRVISRLRAASPLPWPVHVGILNSVEINAYTAGGGYLLLPLGVVKACRTEAELAFVLAHEIAHGLLRHVAQRLEQQLDNQAKLRLLIAVGTQPFMVPTDIIANFGEPMIAGGSLARAIIAAIKAAMRRGTGSAARGVERGAEEAIGARMGRSAQEAITSRVGQSAEEATGARVGRSAEEAITSPMRQSAAETVASRAGRDAAETVGARVGYGAVYRLERDMAEFWRHVVEDMQRLKYSREQELEADRLAVQLLTVAGYNPLEAAGLLTRFPETPFWSVFATHPNPSYRLEQIRRQVWVGQ